MSETCWTSEVKDAQGRIFTAWNERALAALIKDDGVCATADLTARHYSARVCQNKLGDTVVAPGCQQIGCSIIGRDTSDDRYGVHEPLAFRVKYRQRVGLSVGAEYPPSRLQRSENPRALSGANVFP